MISLKHDKSSVNKCDYAPCNNKVNIIYIAMKVIR